MRFLLQCPSCWQDPWCYDCIGVIVLVVFWIVVIIAIGVIVNSAGRKGAGK